MLCIDITSLKPGRHELTEEPDAQMLDLDPDLFRDISVGIMLEYNGKRLHVMLDAEATATLECDRTLVLFDQDVSGQHALYYAPPAFVDQLAEGNDDIRVLLPTDQEIDVTDAVRDTLLLALPARRIAPGAEAVELPTTFGAPAAEEDTIDPRWQALLKLKEQDDN